ncbi:MAG: acetylglutamate kinase [Alphaproteobacteria bacterium]|nr:acetylglutamate kinase [Alphaproteobacteria bacterium]
MTISDTKAWLRTAETIIEALPYMIRFAGQTIVVKYGGHAMGDAALARNFALDVVLLKQVGMNPIVVHGGGPQIGAMLDRLKIKSEFIDGLRVTDEATVEVVEMVLVGQINTEIVASINAAGGTAIGLSGKDGDLIRAEKVTRTTRDPDSNIERVVDLGFVGEPTKINDKVLKLFEQSHIIPVIAPTGAGPSGETLNINADTAAGAIAAATNASKLVMLTDVAGVLDQNKKLISQMTAAEAKELLRSGVATGGMIPKLETCLAALADGAQAAHILDGRIPHVLLLEIFTEHGLGTMIVR